jgi:hypothetical protein
MDFVWVRLPIHIECNGNKNNGGDDDADMPVLPKFPVKSIMTKRSEGG